MTDLPITALALHQRSAPIDARERLLELVMPWRARPDLVVVATCHRVEVYVSGPAHDLVHTIVAAGIGADLRVLVGTDAVTHLFALTAGLDSVVQGEAGIRGQVRAALAAAPRDIDPMLRRALERALSLARSLRGSGTPGRSVGSLAVDAVVSLAGPADRARVLVIGAGEMGSLAVRALSRRVGRVVVANRDRMRAEALARSVGAAAISLTDVAGILADVDAVVSAADTRGALLTESLLATRVASGPFSVVDIAVPRSVGSAARAVTGLVYRSVDDLDGARPLSAVEAERGWAACTDEAARFTREEAGRSAAQAITDVRARAEAIRQHQLDRALHKLGHLNERDRRVVEALAARLVNTVLHEPTVALKRRPERSAGALALFGLSGDTE